MTHAETSDWLIDARTSQRPDAAGAPIDMYATPRGTKSLNRSGPAPSADVVRKLTSPENGVAVKNDAAMLAMPAALSKARPKMEGFPGGNGCSDTASAIETTSPSCLSTLRLMCR